MCFMGHRGLFHKRIARLSKPLSKENISFRLPRTAAGGGPTFEEGAVMLGWHLESAVLGMRLSCYFMPLS